ncbi:glucose-6-phosphate isomerase [Bacilli bacterium PM5-3]|nr:glucose-6-phosphate isomerase [Bacilli bacterium PM5-3]MDH6603460.1 glucose-6-phosphate isomerase [Bacilli bacterium PM5-9]
MIKFDSSNSLSNLNYNDHTNKLKNIIDKMKDGSAKGSEFLGWSKMFFNYDFSLLDNINETTRLLNKKANTMLVIGIGGSYLGTLAIDEALTGRGLNSSKKLIYAGHNISSDYLSEIYEYCQNNDFVINVISKSGTTLESALSFRIFKQLLIDKYGEEALKDRLVITTDAKKGSLRQIASEYQSISFEIPNDVGGRYSVFTPVGLVPLSFIGIDIKKIIEGACLAAKDFYQYDKYNTAFDYAINRYHQYESGKSMEALVVYNPSFASLIEWYRQLFAESEGKDGKGLFPVGCIYSTDLHAVGQFIQDGPEIGFETVLKINNSKKKLDIPMSKDDYDNINRLTKYSLDDINSIITESVISAHSQNGVTPNYVLELDELNEKSLGYLMSFMMYACAYSAYLLDVNPFDQPGVEIYKKEIKKKL